MIPQFSYPFTLNGSDFQTVEQDSPDEIRDCVAVLLQTPIGSREALPRYGSPETLFDQLPVATAGIVAAAMEWEPRATLTIGESLDPYYQTTVHFGVTINE